MTSIDGETRDGSVVGDTDADKVGKGRDPKNTPPAAARQRPILLRWLAHDLPFIAMLLLALGGLVFRLPMNYWLVLIPVFAVLSIIEGWGHFGAMNERLGLIWRVAAIWCAILLSIYFLFTSDVRGVLNDNAMSLAMVTLLALGTFVAGLQARVWRICAVGGLLFLAVPGLGWLDESLPLLAGITCAIIVLSGILWLMRGGARSALA